MSALQEALHAVAADVGYVKKDAKNDHHKYTYASAEAVLGKVRAAFQTHGIAITGSTSEVLQQTEDGLTIARISLTVSKGGESATFQGIGGGKDKQDKGPMKASTAALKYLLANTFLISWGDDPEASDGDSKPAKKGKPAAKKAPAKEAPSSSIDDVLADIAASTTTDALESLRPKVREFSGADKQRLIGAFKNRSKEMAA